MADLKAAMAALARDIELSVLGSAVGHPTSPYRKGDRLQLNGVEYVVMGTRWEPDPLDPSCLSVSLTLMPTNQARFSAVVVVSDAMRLPPLVEWGDRWTGYAG